MSYWTELLKEVNSGVEIYNPDELIEQMASIAEEELEIPYNKAKHTASNVVGSAIVQERV